MTLLLGSQHRCSELPLARGGGVFIGAEQIQLEWGARGARACRYISNRGLGSKHSYQAKKVEDELVFNKSNS